MPSEAIINKERRVAGLIATLLFHSLLLVTFWVVTVAVHPYDETKERKEILIAFEAPKEEPPKDNSILTTRRTNTEETKVTPAPRTAGVKSTSLQPPKPVTTPGKTGNRASATPDKPSTAPQIAKNTVPLTSTAEGNEHGDVERYDPAPDTQRINRLALYNPSMVNDGGDPQEGVTAAVTSDRLFIGGGDDPQTDKSTTTVLGGTSFSLTGRSVVGQMPLPAYSQNLQGKVIVEISVDKDGRVTSAKAGAKGSTVSNAEMWDAARQAALKTRFSSSPTEIVQYGTISYIFRLQ
jgi:TonB family protein